MSERERARIKLLAVAAAAFFIQVKNIYHNNNNQHRVKTLMGLSNWSDVREHAKSPVVRLTLALTPIQTYTLTYRLDTYTDANHLLLQILFPAYVCIDIPLAPLMPVGEKCVLSFPCRPVDTVVASTKTNVKNLLITYEISNAFINRCSSTFWPFLVDVAGDA